jgi:two-component system response regulator HydG
VHLQLTVVRLFEYGNSMTDADNPDAPRPRVLVVDDEPTITNTLGVLLRVSGYDPVPENDSGKAGALIEAGGYDLMITDLRMQPVDGMQLLELAHEKQPDMALIMLTAYGSAEIKDKATSLGASFLDKPFNPTQILSAIAKAIGREVDGQRPSTSSE